MTSHRSGPSAGSLLFSGLQASTLDSEDPIGVRMRSFGRIRGFLLAVLLLLLSGCKPPETVGRSSKPPGDPPETPVFPIHHRYPAWSARGMIAYEDWGIVCVDSFGGYRRDTTLAGLWTVNPSTGEKHRLLATGSMPAWSRDGSKLAVVVGENIFTMNADGSEPRQLTSRGSNLFPAWNSDGTWIAFQGIVPTFPAVWIMRADGSDKQVVGDEEGYRYPCWNPIEPVIVHSRYLVGFCGAELFTMDERRHFLYGTRLTSNQADDREPDYSPDGQRIAFASQPAECLGQPGTAPDLRTQIWVMNADGAGARQLTQNGGEHPSWSPDGFKLVYVRQDWQINTPENGVLWVIDVASGEESQLTFKWSERCTTSVSDISWTRLKEQFR